MVCVCNMNMKMMLAHWNLTTRLEMVWGGKNLLTAMLDLGVGADVMLGPMMSALGVIGWRL
jgi:hypothetical protein